MTVFKMLLSPFTFYTVCILMLRRIYLPEMNVERTVVVPLFLNLLKLLFLNMTINNKRCQR